MVNWYRDSLLKLTFIGVQLLYNVVLVSTVQQNDLCMCIHISLSFWTSLHSGHQCIKQSSLCYTVGSHQLSILCILSAVYMCQCQSPNLSHPTPLPFSIHMFVLYVCVSISSLEIRSLLPVLHLAFKNALCMEVGPPYQKSLKTEEYFPVVVKERFVSMCQRDLTLMV